MRHTKTINMDLRCPKCNNPMQKISKNKKLKCIYCESKYIKNECIKLEKERKG